MTPIKDVIFVTFNNVLDDQDIVLKQPVGANDVLLETGLDSLGFAILVSELEDKLGYDPFVLMDEPVYPRTMDEFVAIYEKFSSHRVAG